MYTEYNMAVLTKMLPCHAHSSVYQYVWVCGSSQPNHVWCDAQRGCKVEVHVGWALIVVVYLDYNQKMCFLQVAALMEQAPPSSSAKGLLHMWKQAGGQSAGSHTPLSPRPSVGERVCVCMCVIVIPLSSRSPVQSPRMRQYCSVQKDNMEASKLSALPPCCNETLLY